MRIYVSFLTLVMTAWAQAPVPEVKPETLCSVEGRILDVATGEPLGKVTLMLRQMDMGAAMGSGVPSYFTTVTGADGRFAMRGIEAGSYRLGLSRNGYLRTEYGAKGPGRQGTTLKLEAGQRMTGVDFKLYPHGVITGRVRDEDGEGVAYVQVAAMRQRFIQGQRQMVPGGMATTNDLGEFRMFGVAPGRYYLSATVRGGMGMFGMGQDRTAGGAPEESYLPTYYPGTLDASGAAVLEVGAGQVVSGMEMRVLKAKTVRLKGQIVAEGSMPRDVMLTLTPQGEIGFFTQHRAVASGPRKEFQFTGLGPGSYTLNAMAMEGPSRLVARQAIEVGTAHMDGLVVRLEPGMTVAGDVTVRGAQPGKVDLTGVRVILSEMTPGGGGYGGGPENLVKEDGKFQLTNLLAGRYILMPYGLPDGYYLRSVHLGNQAVEPESVEIAAGGAVMHLEVAEGAATLAGSVMNDKKEAMPGATVVVSPVKEARAVRQEFVKTATTDQSGRFTVKNLDPGDYKVFAWEDIESGEWMDPDVRKPVERKAVKVTLREGGTETVELVAIRNE